MSRYGRCGRCARSTDCAVLLQAKTALAGHGKLISSVKVNCRRIYESDFQPGDRVMVRGLSSFPDRSTATLTDKARSYLCGNTGTVMSWSKSGKVNVLLDLEDEHCTHIEVQLTDWAEPVPWCRLQSFWHIEVMKIDEPTRSVCEPCGVPLDEAGAAETWIGRENQKCGGCTGFLFEQCPQSEAAKSGMLKEAALP